MNFSKSWLAEILQYEPLTAHRNYDNFRSNVATHIQRHNMDLSCFTWFKKNKHYCICAIYLVQRGEITMKQIQTSATPRTTGRTIPFRHDVCRWAICWNPKKVQKVWKTEMGFHCRQKRTKMVRQLNRQSVWDLQLGGIPHWWAYPPTRTIIENTNTKTVEWSGMPNDPWVWAVRGSPPSSTQRLFLNFISVICINNIFIYITLFKI